jgi:uncharacterized protein YjgD (DUF1641 family)
MAQPISFEVVPRDPRKDLMARLESAPQEHVEALLESYELLQEMHDRQILQLLRGALSAGDKLVEAGVKAIDDPTSVKALRNLIILMKMMGSIDPEVLQCFAAAAGETMGSEKKPVTEPPGLLSLLNQFRQTESRRSIAFMGRFLQVLGSQLQWRGHKGGRADQPGVERTGSVRND